MNRGISFERDGIDTLTLCRKFMPEDERKNLEHACEFFGIDTGGAHRAMKDARAAHLLFQRLKTVSYTHLDVYKRQSFYGLDFSEVPVLVGTFSMGPVAGVIIELVKILVKLIIKPTTTGGVGELANFCIGCSLLLPAGLIYHFRRTKVGAIAGMAAGTVTMAIVGAVINALVMLPFYSNFMPLDTIIAAGAAINPAISNVWTFAWLCVAPFNMVKGVATALVTALVYKRISVVIHLSLIHISS